MNGSKSCRGCFALLPLHEYSKNRRYKDELDPKCKSCHQRYYQEHYDQKREIFKRWRQKHPEYAKQYRESSEARRDYERQYYLQHKTKYIASVQKQRELNPLYVLQREQIYRKQNREKINEYHREWKAEKRKTDVQYRLKSNVSRRIRYELNTLLKSGTKKNYRTLEYLSTSVEHLQNYLGGRFEIGMNWQNYGRVWHMDHIIPCAYWNFKRETDSLLCWHYRNLSPLWSSKNKSKKDTVNPHRLLYYTTLMKTVLFGL